MFTSPVNPPPSMSMVRLSGNATKIESPWPTSSTWLPVFQHGDLARTDKSKRGRRARAQRLMRCALADVRVATKAEGSAHDGIRRATRRALPAERVRRRRQREAMREGREFSRKNEG